METEQIWLLALLQGFTEFLPISSSAHLILAPKFFGWADQGLGFDIAVHIGSLIAVLIHLRPELMSMVHDSVLSMKKKEIYGDARLALGVIIGTVPAVIVGLLIIQHVETILRQPYVIAAATVLFGLLLGYADKRDRRNRIEGNLLWRHYIFIGLMQALALIPGTSRSGITITAGLLLGMSRSASARFSFLLSIPIILAAGTLKGIQLVQQAPPVDWVAIVLGLLISGVSAYICIHLFLKWIERISMMPFVIYRLLLGTVLIISF